MSKSPKFMVFHLKELIYTFILSTWYPYKSKYDNTNIDWLDNTTLWHDKTTIAIIEIKFITNFTIGVDILAKCGPTINIQNIPNSVNADCLASKSKFENLKVSNERTITTPTTLFSLPKILLKEDTTKIQNKRHNIFLRTKAVIYFCFNFLSSVSLIKGFKLIAPNCIAW